MNEEGSNLKDIAKKVTNGLKTVEKNLEKEAIQHPIKTTETVEKAIETDGLSLVTDPESKKQVGNVVNNIITDVSNENNTNNPSDNTTPSKTTNNPFDNTINSSGTNNKKSFSSGTDILSTLTSPLIFLIISIMIWVFDWWVLKFDRLPVDILIIGLIYLVFSIFYWIVESATEGINLSSIDELKESFKPLAIGIFVSILQCGIPRLILLLLPNYEKWIWIIMAFIAPWTFYFIFLNNKENSAIEKIRVIWIILLVIVILFFSAGTLIQSAITIGAKTSLAASPKESLQDFWDMMKGKVADIKLSVNETINAKLYPQDAKSQIDKNSDARLGVFINNVKPLGRTFFALDPFEVIAEMETTTLFSEIIIKTECFAETSNREIKIKGESEYNEFFVQGIQKDILQCQFPEGLAKGRYSLYFEADFNFETWAYLDYTFVDKELSRNYYREGKDINADLDIEKEPIPIFTDGPAQILMIAASQPIEIDFEKEEVLPAFGIILDKNWQYGDIEKIDTITVQIPKMIELVGCSIATDKVQYLEQDPDTGKISDYFNYYLFTEPSEDIVCRMKIDENMYKQEKGINSKLVKTVVVNARYKYKIPSKKETITVEEAYS